MTSLLHWRYAGKTDRRLRQSFTCAIPPRATWRAGSGLTHPAPWELEVQSWIRQHPLASDEYMLLGLGVEAPNRIEAVVTWTDLDGTEDVLVQAIAVSSERRHGGGTCAREALEVALTEIDGRARAAGHQQVLVLGRIHHGNGPSEKLFDAAGFTPLLVRAEMTDWVCVRKLTDAAT